MKNFQIKICPLCGKLLKILFLYSPNSDYQGGYYCEENYPIQFYIQYASETRFYSHYEVLTSEHSLRLQQFIIPPYLCNTFINSGRTEVYILPNEKGPARFIMEIPAMTPDNPKKLLKKIDMLVAFS